MSLVEEQIRDAARQYLQNKEVTCVIGYERGPKGGVRPAFIYDAGDAQRLMWGPECNLNLVNYVHNFKAPPRRGEPIPKVAVVVRPCDARAINLLIHEQQIKRENVKAIGVACSGGEIAGRTRPACQSCRERTPVVSDVLIDVGAASSQRDGQPAGAVSPQRDGETQREPSLPQTHQPPEPEGHEQTPDDYADVVEMENWTPQQRLEYWLKEFDRCIRCYACRQACPGCYCFECVAEQVDPHWTSIAMAVPEKYFFHVMRAFHLAGRCVGCDACTAVCPMGIRLDKLNRKLAKEIEALFGYHTGDDPKTAPPLATFDPKERLRL